MRGRGRWAGTVAWLAGGACALAGLVTTAEVVRLHLARAEIRNSVAAAALAAAAELDGTREGLVRARQAALEAWRRSVIATAVATMTGADFAASPAGPWHSQPNALAHCGFVRVRAAGALPLSALTFLRIASSRAVQAEAIAGQPLAGQTYDGFRRDGPGAARLVAISLGVAGSAMTE